MSKIMFEHWQLGSQTKKVGLKWYLNICDPFDLLASPSAPLTAPTPGIFHPQIWVYWESGHGTTNGIERVNME